MSQSDGEESYAIGGRPRYYDQPMKSASVRLPEEMKELLRKAGGPGGMSRAVRVLVENNRSELEAAADHEDGL